MRTLTALALVTLAVPTLVSAQNRDRNRSDRGDFHWEKSLPGGQLVRVTNINGNVTVTPSSSGRVEIVGIRHGSSRSVDDITAEVKETSNGIIVCVVWRDSDGYCDDRGYHSRGDWDDRGNASMDLEVRLPSNLEVNASSVSGDVSVSGAEGDVRASSVSGDVHLERLRATSVSVSSVSGSISAGLESLGGRGDLSFKSVSGDITLDLPRSLDADLSMSTVSGQLDSDFQMTLNGRMDRRRMQARIGRGGRALDVSTVSGDVRLRASR